MADYIDTSRRTVVISEQELETLGALVAGDDGHEGIVVYHRFDKTDAIVGVVPLGEGHPYCFAVDEAGRQDLERRLKINPKPGEIGWMDFVTHPKSLIETPGLGNNPAFYKDQLPGCALAQLRRRTGADPKKPGYNHNYRCLLISHKPGSERPNLRVCVPADPIVGGLLQTPPVSVIASPNLLDLMKVELQFDFYTGVPLLETTVAR